MAAVVTAVVAGGLNGVGALALGADFVTTSAAEITAAMQVAVPGDTIIMANGTWTNQSITLSGNGSAGSPITIRAETPGRVILNGTSKVAINGDHLVVEGLNFRGGALGAGEYVVRFNSSASNSRFTNSAIVDYNPVDPATRYFWVGISGQDNRVDGNLFRGQNNSGVTVVVSPVVGTPSRARIDGNHFADRPVGTGNGFETIRIGTSDVQTASAQVVVEGNLFERTNGEAECISNKTWDNVFRNNTFREVQGTLTLRHGGHATVESNFFLGDNVTQTGAIRIIGPDHIVRNNFIADIGSRSNGAIVLTAGEANFVRTGVGNTSGYEPVTNVQIVNNTVINAKDATVRLDDLYSSSTQNVRPSGVTIANNLLYNTQTSLIKGTAGPSFTYSGNIAFGSSLGVSANAGLRQVNPLVSRDGLELYRFPATSPAVNTATTGSWAAPGFDVEGQARTSPLDVGADELSTEAVVNRPLYGADVGPGWVTRRSFDINHYVVPVVRVEAEAFTAVTDPNGDGSVWQTVLGADGRTALKAPTGARVDVPAMTHDTIVEYDVAFYEAGTYFLTAVVRGFDTSSDSLYLPATLGAEPTVSRSVVSTGEWTLVDLGTYTVSASQLNLPLTLKIGRREQSVEMDYLLFAPLRFPATVPEPSVAGLVVPAAVAATTRRSGRGK